MMLFVARRLAYMVPMLVAFSLLAFAVLQLQPGDFLSRHALTLSPETRDQLRALYGLDRPLWVQYLKWVEGILTRGDFGRSFETQQPVVDHLFRNGNRLGWSLLLVGVTFVFSWLIAVPLGILSAAAGRPGRRLLARARRGLVRLIDLLALAGLSLPNFLSALLLLWLLVAVLHVGERYGLGVGGLFDAAYVDAPWSWAKLGNFLWHLWPALLVIGLGNVARLMRQTRAHLQDVLAEPYLQTARAKGLAERVVLFKHAARVALNPLISLLGFWIPSLFEGTLVAAVVLQLPVVERAYWRALTTEDQYVVMTGLLFFAAVLLVGNLIADVLLALSDPRIRYE